MWLNLLSQLQIFRGILPAGKLGNIGGYCLLKMYFFVLFPVLIVSYPSPVKGGVDAKELFHLYIMLWIQDKRLAFLESCKLDKVWYFGYGIFFLISLLNYYSFLYAIMRQKR